MEAKDKNEEGNTKRRFFRADIKQRKSIVKAARLGSVNAVRASRALGLDITYIKNGILYKEKPDGNIIETPLNNITATENTYKLKKGMVLYAKK